MRLILVSALALAVGLTNGYLNTSPFFMFTTSESQPPISDGTPPQLQSATALSSSIVDTLSKCPTDIYLIISQPGVRPDDYASRKTTPALSQRMTHGSKYSIKASKSVAEVVGDIDVTSIHTVLAEKCGVYVDEIDAATGSIPTTYDMLPRLYNIRLPAPGQATRQKDMSANDAFFASVMDIIPSQNYTVMYVTSAGDIPRRASGVEGGQYEMESSIQEALHLDLKRDLGSSGMQKRDNQTAVDGPLFAKYQFFTPGLFMGLVVGFLLLSILYVGISALASLQVTYAAFDKESGLKSQ